MSEPPSDSDRTYAVLMHLSVLVVLAAGPIVMWLAGHGRSTFVDAHGRDAMLFHGATLSLVAVVMAIGMIGHGIILLMIVTVGLLIGAASFALRAAWRADRGDSSGYPGIAWMRSKLARAGR